MLPTDIEICSSSFNYLAFEIFYFFYFRFCCTFCYNGIEMCYNHYAKKAGSLQKASMCIVERYDAYIILLNIACDSEKYTFILYTTSFFIL